MAKPLPTERSRDGHAQGGAIPGPSAAALDAQLRTDHLLSDLKNRTVASGVVTLTSQAAQFLLSLGSVMILARLLSPEDYGLVAMVTSATAFLRVFKDAGLATATVQTETITHAQVSNLFWINALLSGAVGLVAAAMAPPLAWIYREPRIVAVALALAVPFLVNGLAIQHRALLSRQMRFRALALVDVGSSAGGVGLAIPMAFGGFGWWALVGQSLMTATIEVALLWSVSRWRPQRPARGSGLRPLLGLGANLTGAGLVYFLTQSVDSFLIGRYCGAGAVGLYSRAMGLLLRPLQQILQPVSAVFVPVLSRLQDDEARYRRAFQQVYDAMALAGLVLAGWFLALSHPLTLVLLGRKWEGAAAIFAGLAIAALYQPVANAALWLLVTQGRGREVLLVNLSNGALAVAAFVSGLPWGPAGVAIAWSVSGLVLRTPLYFCVVGRRGPVRTSTLFVRFLLHVPVGLVVVSATALACHLTRQAPPLVQLAISAPAGLLAACGVILLYSPARLTVARVWTVIRERPMAGAVLGSPGSPGPE